MLQRPCVSNINLQPFELEDKNEKRLAFLRNMNSSDEGLLISDVLCSLEIVVVVRYVSVLLLTGRRYGGRP